MKLVPPFMQNCLHWIAFKAVFFGLGALLHYSFQGGMRDEG